MPEGYERQLYAGMLRQDLGPALVIEDDEGVLCLCGAIIIWPGVAEIWLKLVRKDHLLSVLKELRRLLRLGVKKFRVRRLQACVEKGFDKGCRFAELFDFEKEAVLKKHSYNGKDNIMYARLF